LALESVVREINRKVHQILPRNRFIAATLVAVNHGERTAQVWTGGNPPLLLVDENGKARLHDGERHLALGILNDDQFDARPDMLPLDGVREILCYSDGLPEAEDARGEAFGLARILAASNSKTTGSTLERLLDAVHDHLGESSAQDDLSCALIACAPEHFPVGQVAVGQVATAS
jgi:serine phosphatase RsbU (regulator of sigma subunit)